MLLRAFVATLLLAWSPANPQTLEASPLPKVVCPVPNGFSMGSAFRVGPSLLISAKHVTSFPKCYIDGRLITVEYTSPDRDYSILTDGREGKSFTVDCAGFVKGRRYVALGHARGLDQVIGVEVTATGVTDPTGFAVLTGTITFIPGQSGGPVVDAETGKVVGLVNVYDFQRGMSGSIALKDTSICQRAVVAGRA